MPYALACALGAGRAWAFSGVHSKPMRYRSLSWLPSAWAIVLAAACSASEPAATVRAAPPPRPEAHRDSGRAADAPAAEHAAEESRSTVLVVSDPTALAALEESGLDLGTRLDGSPARTTKQLASREPYRALVKAVARDLTQDRRRDPSAGVGMRHAHRQFDVRWLDSEQTRFELIAVVNRLDRKPFAPQHCGEVRFVYRLSYRTETLTGPVASRLPMTINVVDFVPQAAGGGCGRVARSWLGPPQLAFEGTPFARWLVSADGALAPGRLRTFRPKSLELNFQSVRWPSTVRPSLGGHAEYTLRAFRRSTQAPFLEPMLLENSIDAARLARQPALVEKLGHFLRTPEALARLDAGTLLVPDEFLAERAVSVSPHGLARGANRPFRQVLASRAFANLDLSRYETIRSPLAALRRLDALSCSGCHQSRSIAGFHLLGVERADDGVDAVQVPMSPHFHGDLARRARYVTALAEGREEASIRPPAERDEERGYAARCGLGDPGFADWSCAPGLRCTRVTDGELGVCLPEVGRGVGDACERGPIAYAPDGHRDAARLAAPDACHAGRACEVNAVGFPSGMCAGGCSDLPEGSVCGGIPVLAEFNACLARGVSFERCIRDNTRPGALRACSFHAPCRDDYVCARWGDGGACLPPYFLFQLRVDGHPILASRP